MVITFGWRAVPLAARSDGLLLAAGRAVLLEVLLEPAGLVVGDDFRIDSACDDCILGPGLAVLDPKLPPGLAVRSPLALAWKDLLHELDHFIDHGLAPA